MSDMDGDDPVESMDTLESSGAAVQGSSIMSELAVSERY